MQNNNITRDIFGKNEVSNLAFLEESFIDEIKSGNDIVLSSGRYGPYIKCAKTNYAIPKELRGKIISLDDALKIMETKK